MRKVTMVIALFLLSAAAASADDVADIKSMIEESYVNGAFNGLDPDAMRRGFHEDFAIFWAEGEEIGKYPIETWAANTEKQKADPEFDPKNNVWEHKLPIIEVTGGAASVKVELYRNGELVFTDYLSLLKFDSGWRIVAKVYHRHEQ
jgi:hypothetical protein